MQNMLISDFLPVSLTISHKISLNKKKISTQERFKIWAVRSFYLLSFEKNAFLRSCVPKKAVRTYSRTQERTKWTHLPTFDAQYTSILSQSDFSSPKCHHSGSDREGDVGPYSYNTCIPEPHWCSRTNTHGRLRAYWLPKPTSGKARGKVLGSCGGDCLHISF